MLHILKRLKVDLKSSIWTKLSLLLLPHVGLSDQQWKSSSTVASEVIQAKAISGKPLSIVSIAHDQTYHLQS